MTGIVGYGSYVPRYRIRVEDIAKVWGDAPDDIRAGLMIGEKAVPAGDEDAATMAVEAARNALGASGIDSSSIGAIFVGSESHPYAVKPTATVVAQAVGASPHLTAADMEFACKAGTAGIQACLGMVRSGMVDVGLAIGADVSQAAPGDALEYTAGAGGCAYLVGEDPIAEIEDTCSFTTDTPDFWRREGEKYPQHGGRFTGEPAYFRHVIGSSERLMELSGTGPSDYDYAVFHQPNGKFPRRAAKRLGFEESQYETAILVDRIGNTYSGSTPLGLARVLDVASPGDRILVTSFGSGAGSDSFSICVTRRIEERRAVPTVEDQICRKTYLDYSLYAKHQGKIDGGDG
ncbi:MAG: Hydroxymethylglutaryl-CoA synthase [Methanonatronarchaeales archaeon]|nr:Hydroxymethylglutaryl-CoA synthase [Methanonatronarchaeales archaeon]